MRRHGRASCDRGTQRVSDDPIAPAAPVSGVRTVHVTAPTVGAASPSARARWTHHGVVDMSMAPWATAA